MLLKCSFIAPICRADLCDYVQEIEVDVECYDEECSERHLVGRISLSRILWARAIADGESPSEVFDDSQGLRDAYAILADGGPGTRGGFRIDDRIDHAIFIRRFLLHPDLDHLRQGVLDAALTLFGAESLAVAWGRTIGLGEDELANLGFARIAPSDLLCRHSARKSRFSIDHPRGLGESIDAEPRHAAWVEREWANPKDGG